MTRILGSGIAVPPYKVTRSLTEEYAKTHFGPHLRDFEKYLPVFANTGIDTRYLCVPAGWFMSPKSLGEKNRTYIELATELGAKAAENCLHDAEILPEKIDNIIFVSTTGMATPTIDARLINIMGFRPDIRRSPLWGFGCVGGAAGLIAADDYIRAHPGSKVLLISVELCCLTFLFDDYSISNLIATSLFSDGAAAVLLGDDGDGPEIMATHMKTWPDSLDVMGWNFLDDGLQVVFSKSIPGIVRKYVRDDISGFLESNHISLADIQTYLIHPGGPKVLDSYRSALDLDQDSLRFSEYIIRNYGNMSSATVLYILDNFLHSEHSDDGSGILTALGPGFTAGSLLFRY